MSSSSNGYGGSSSDLKPEYIFDIPIEVRRRVCKEIDAAEMWERMALDHFGFQKSDLQVSKTSQCSQ